MNGILGEWPLSLEYGELRLRSLRRRDEAAWVALRMSNAQWLEPWEATSPEDFGAADGTGLSFKNFVRQLDTEVREGAGLPLAIEYRGLVAGQVWVSQIGYGAVWGASIGYWVGSQFAGRRIAPAAVALVSDYCFFEVGLHRLEINIRPENERSLSVANRLGFRFEGVRKSYIHIAGDWRDHHAFALTKPEVPQGVMQRWLTEQKPDLEF